MLNLQEVVELVSEDLGATPSGATAGNVQNDCAANGPGQVLGLASRAGTKTPKKKKIRRFKDFRKNKENPDG